jgi:hypothetical protein
MRASSTRLVVAAAAVLTVGCGGSSGPSGVVTPPEPTFQNVQSTIFTPSCAITNCHVGGAAAPFGLDLSAGASYANLVNVASAEAPGFDRVEPGVSQDSYLYMKVVDDPRITGDPMPALGPPLSAQKLQLLADWIGQGASP